MQKQFVSTINIAGNIAHFMRNPLFGLSSNIQLLEQNFSLLLFAAHVGDPYGQRVMLGGNRLSNESAGASLLDIEEQLIENLRKVTVLNAAKVTLIGKTKVRTNYVKRNTPFVFRELNFNALVSHGDGTPAQTATSSSPR